MTPFPFTAWVARVAAITVAVGAVAGSSAHLYKMAVAAGTPAAWAVPVGLDCTAFAAAAARRWHRDDVSAQRTLVISVLLSASLQVADALGVPTRFTAPVLVVVPPLAAWRAFEMFLRATETPGTTDTLEAPAVPVERTGPEAPAADRSRAPRPVKERKPRATAPVAASLQDLVPVAETAALELAVAGKTLSRRTLQEAMEAAGHPVRSDRRAGELLRLLKAAAAPAEPEPARELAEVTT